MAELIARSPLAGCSPFAVHGIEVRERTDLTAIRVTTKGPIVAEGAIQLGPRDWLLLGEGPPPSTPGLARDATSGLVFIQVAGPGAADALGLSTLARGERGALTTRLADLRVTVSYRTQPHHNLLLIADRFSAQYLWEWLAAKIAVTMTVP